MEIDSEMTQMIELSGNDIKDSYYKSLPYVEEGKGKHKHVKETWRHTFFKKIQVDVLYVA